MKAYKLSTFKISDRVIVKVTRESGIIRYMVEMQDMLYEFGVQVNDSLVVRKCLVDYHNNESSIDRDEKYYRNIKLNNLLQKKMEETVKYRNTLLIAAFPGTGKSHLFRNPGDKIVLDSDSSTFDKSDFPANYIRHIKENMGKADIICISSHKEVREALVDAGLHFLLVYPNISLKDEYVERYVERGSPQGFVDLISKNWDAWVSECGEQPNCDKMVLEHGEYISNHEYKHV